MHNIWTSTNGYLRPVLVQLTGLVAFVAMLVFWMITGRVSTPMLAGAGSLISFGMIGSAVRGLASNTVAREAGDE